MTSVSAGANGLNESIGGCHEATLLTHNSDSRVLMPLRKFFAQLGCLRDAEEIDPPVPPHPQAHLTVRSSSPEPLPSTSQGQNSNRTTGTARPSSEVSPVPTLPIPNVSATPSASVRHPPVPDVDESKLVKLSSYIVDPTAAYKSKSDRESTLHASSAGLVIDARTPLKSVVESLSAILKYYDQAAANRKTIESLIPRVEGLAESLATPAPEGETKEIERRQALRLKLEEALRDLGPLAERGKNTGVINNVKDAGMLTGLTEDIRDAMMDYQTALQQDIYHKNQQLIDKADLSLLKGMQHTAGAGFLAGNRTGCLRGTRRDVLLDIEQWLMDEKDQRVFWLNGLAGTGKSTIAQTFAEISFADGKLGASFFCSRDFGDRSNLQAIFPTLAFQLAHRYPRFREQLLQALRANHDVERESLNSQIEKLIVRPLKETRISTLIIIDALDECKDKEPASALLSVLSRHVHEIPEVKFFITGRPEPPIREGFRLKPLRPITEVLKLHDVKRSLVDEDIKLYFRTYLTDLRNTRGDCKFPEEWPISYDIDILCKKAGGLFIYASTVVKFVASEYHLPTKRLDLILRSQGTAHEGRIDLLYTQVLQLAFQGADPGDQELYSNFRNVVGAVLLVLHPLSRKALSNLLRNCESPSQISTTLRFFHSLLNVPDSEDDPIWVFHKSFPDFLTDQTRCKDDRFFVDLSIHHEEILFSCLDLMKKHLKKNICDLDDYAVLSEVNDLSVRKETCIGSSLEYACRFWTKHLLSVPADGPHAKQIQEAIDEFFAKRLLCWMEVLSIVGHLGVVVYTINDIRQWYISAGISTCEQADDSERLILEYFDAICGSPSHIYHSALPLSPSSSWLRKCYKGEIVGEIRVLMGLPEQWDACSRTIFLEGQPTAFAHWGDILAVGFGPNAMLLDAITGTRTSVLCGHEDRVRSLAFSPDGTLLVSRSDDTTAKVWDIQTGGAIRTFDDRYPFVSVAISPDGATIALGTTNGHIHLWDVRTGKRHPIELKDGIVTILSFSPIDSQRFISSSWHKSIHQWDVDGRRFGSYQEADNVDDLAYASDGTCFVSCGGRVATVRDSNSGKVVVKLDAPDRRTLDRCCFSPDGKFVACTAGITICVWDITTPGGRLVGQLVGHSEPVSFVAFSSSLISVSQDRSVKFWQSSSFLANSKTAKRRTALHGSTPIKSVNLFAEDEIVVTSDSSGVVKTWNLMTGLPVSSFSTPAKGERDTHLAGGTLTIVWCTNEEKEYHIWNVYKSKLLRKADSSLSDLGDLKISGDGTKVFGRGSASIEAVSMRTGKAIGSVHFEVGQLSSFFVHGSKVGIGNSRSRGWDFGGRKVSDFGEFPDRPRLDLVDVSTGPGVKPRWIEDTATKRLIFRIPERYLSYGMEIEWDGRYLILWSRSGEVVVMDFNAVCPQ